NNYSIGDALGTPQSFSDMGAYKFTLVANGTGTSVMHYVTADPDDDNDGVPDTTDAFDTDATETVDTDGDGTGDNADTDDDEDTVPDANEATGCTLVVDCDGDT
ncbi:MAG: hypothetical protein VXV98_09980, partial [Candidatus Thermoplasmatota archaeon]|nr:hypothetical protein [Candidatus Thermoplasmatota archaeon]